MEFGLILDLETTGINPEQDRIIEIGLIEFIPGDGSLKVLNMYGALEDPGLPLSEDVKKLTGLDDAMLQGQRIAWEYVRALMSRASVIVAHNADFDRGFMERRPEMAGLTCHWACSMKHIDWESKGFRTRALNYLAADHGFVNPFAHRALFDCATTLRLIDPYFSEMSKRSHLREWRLLASHAPYEMKDKLRNQRYRWDNVKRVWYKDILEDTLEVERAFLQNEIYQGRHDTHEELELAGQNLQEDL